MSKAWKKRVSEPKDARILRNFKQFSDFEQQYQFLSEVISGTIIYQCRRDSLLKNNHKLSR